MITENVDLKKLNTYGIGGHARYLIEPNSTSELQATLSDLKEKGIPWYIFGGGSNIIIPDEDFAGAIIKLSNLNNIQVYDDVFVVESGVTLGVMINKMLELGFTNYAPLMGIPGTIGGAIIGNAGANGIDIFTNLLSVKVLNSDGTVEIIAKENIIYAYRETEFKNSDRIILNASFKCTKGDILVAKKMIQENLVKRKNTQPLEYKNAGSVFKNPEGYASGKLIEEAGLKGRTIGGAQVSKKHANFIINLGNATSSDIINLIDLIKKEVKDKFNIDLTLEQRIIKW